MNVHSERTKTGENRKKEAFGGIPPICKNQPFLKI